MKTREIIVRQYHAPLKMLRQAIEICPEELWLAGAPNRFWHLAYHALFYTHFYLSAGEQDFVPWEKHRAEYNFLGEVPWRPNEVHIADIPYTRAELMDYAEICMREAEARTAVVDLEAPSGFHWLPFDKLELQFYNIRHLQHHTGQLADRLRQQAGVGVAWVR